MKRFLLLFAVLIGFGISVRAQQQPTGEIVKEVTLSNGTDLASALGNDVGKVTTLKVSGRLTDADFKTMKEQMTMLQVLDMGGVTELSTTYNRTNVIPSNALENKLTLNKVVFPAGLQIIGNYAFKGCNNIEELDFSKATQLQYIEYSAFNGCSGLKKLDLSNHMELLDIGSSTFSSCSNLRTVNLAGCNKLTSIAYSAFNYCALLQSVDLSHCSALTTIGESAFYSTSKLETVKLEGCTALTTIESNAFNARYSNQSETFDFDFSQLTALTHIGNSAFCDRALTGDIVFASAINQIGEGAFSGCDQITGIDFTKSTKLAVISYDTFSGCRQLKKVDFTNCSSLNTLNIGAFNDCPALESVEINNGFFKSIDGAIFVVDGATLLLYPAGKTAESYTVPAKVKTIKEQAFPYNPSLKQVTIPANVLSIMGQAFYSNMGNQGLKVIMESPTPIGLSQSIGLNNVLVYVPKGSADAYRNAAFWSESKIMEIGADPTTIALDAAGTLSEKVAGLSTPKNTIAELIIIGPMNAADFEIIKQMEMLEKVDLSGAKLEEDVLPNNAFYNGNYGSNRLNYLKEVVLPNTIKEIGSDAFYRLTSLQKINLPSSIETIGSNAFYECNSLAKVDLSTLINLKRIGSSAFSGSSMIKTDLKLPNTLEDIEYSVFYNTGVTTVDFSNTVISYIGNYAFSGCPITGNIVFPATLQRIYSEAFAQANLSSITLKASNKVQLDGANVFQSTDKASCIVKVPKGLKETYKADPYWAAFGENIQEFGQMIAATSNNEEYGTVIGGGAYEEGETATLLAMPREVTWNKWDYHYIHFFEGWYEGETKVSSEASYNHKVAKEDKTFTGKFTRIDFRVSIIGDNDWIQKVTSDNKSVTVQMNLPEYATEPYGWFENNQCVSTEKVLTVVAGSEDRHIDLRPIENDYYGETLITDDNKVGNLDITFDWGNMTVEGEKAWNLNSFTFSRGFDRQATLLVNSPMTAKETKLQAEIYGGWQFITLPYDLKLSEITPAYEEMNSQFVVRRYDGQARAANGIGDSWKQLGTTDVLKANQGYIIRTDNGGRFNFTAASGMDALFNRQSVTIPLTAYKASSVMDANWNLVGNPYPCFYDIAQLFEDGLDATVTVWSPELNNYEYYTADDADVYLSPLTAFFVQKNKSDLLFKPEGRVVKLPENETMTRSTLRSADGRTVINLVLANDSLSDRTRVVFNEAATDEYELGKDAAKFRSLNANAPALYSLDKNNSPLAINERPQADGVVRLGVAIGVSGRYTISLREASDRQLTLVDRQTGATCDLSKEAYRFEAQAGELTDRFELRSDIVTSIEEIAEGFRWRLSEGRLMLEGCSADATLTITDALGRIVYNGKTAEGSEEVNLPQAGIYYLTLTAKEGQRIVRSIKR